MLRPFKFFEQRRDFVVIACGAQSQRARRNLERSSRLRLACMGQPKAEQVVDDRLERFAAATDLLFEEHRNVVVDGEGCSHIMMLVLKAS